MVSPKKGKLERDLQREVLHGRQHLLECRRIDWEVFEDLE